MATLEQLLQLQQKYLTNKELFDKEKKIESGLRSDGFLAEALVIDILNWTKHNNINNKDTDAYAGPLLGLVDIKTGSAKKYSNIFCLEAIQNPKSAIKADDIYAGISAWLYEQVDHIAYLDLSDDDFPLYIFSVEKLKKYFATNQILNYLNIEHMKHYDSCWTFNGKLQTPRKAEDAPPQFWCFGNKALGFELHTDLASDKINLRELVEQGDEDDRQSSDKHNRTNQTETNSSVSVAKVATKRNTKA